MEEFSVEDPTQLHQAASDFASHPGFHTDTSAKEFLDRFPLPVIINALQTKADVPGLEEALIACLERIFKTKYGASLIPHYMQFVVVGLGADSQRVRSLVCKTVYYLLENYDEGANLVRENNAYPLLLNCLVEGDEQVATSSIDVIKNLAVSAVGLEMVFPHDINDPTHLRNLASRCSSLGRVRVMALIVKLFSISHSVASVVYNSNLLDLLLAEIRNVNDTLVTLSVLEILYELAEIQHCTEFLSQTTLLQLLSSIISEESAESILRSRAMMIIGRLMLKENTYTFIDESSAKKVISAIDERLVLLESQDADERECALETLGQIGSTIEGAEMVLVDSHPAARHVINAAFDLHGRGKQLAALHALGNICGETRSISNRTLNADAEESLRRLIYSKVSSTSKLTPSGLFVSILQQESDTRLAGYRVITGLVARPWCLMEICSRREIILIVTDTSTETTKIGMEARHKCCQAIHNAFMSSTKLLADTSLAGIESKLQEAVKKGPYRGSRQSESQPVVDTAERF
jgi:26S proteasome non-ATPase regulatory subunit 5